MYKVLKNDNIYDNKFSKNWHSYSHWGTSSRRDIKQDKQIKVNWGIVLHLAGEPEYAWGASFPEQVLCYRGMVQMTFHLFCASIVVFSR